METDRAPKFVRYMLDELSLNYKQNACQNRFTEQGYYLEMGTESPQVRTRKRTCPIAEDILYLPSRWREQTPACIVEVSVN